MKYDTMTDEEFAADEELSRRNMKALYESLQDDPFNSEPIYLGDGVWLYPNGECDVETKGE